MSVISEWQIPLTHQCGHAFSIFICAVASSPHPPCNKTPAALSARWMTCPHHVFKETFGLTNRTIITTVSFPSTDSSTFLVYQHASTLLRFFFSFGSIKTFLVEDNCSTKQLPLSWLNGFHHSPPFIRPHGEERACDRRVRFITIQVLLEQNETFYRLIFLVFFFCSWSYLRCWNIILKDNYEFCEFSVFTVY